MDIGGDKIRSARYTVHNGELSIGDEQVMQSRGGAGYLDFLERLARDAEQEDLQVGISSATKLDGSVIARTVNLPILRDEMRHRYGGDYARIFPGRSFVQRHRRRYLRAAKGWRRGELVEHAVIICASGMGGR